MDFKNMLERDRLESKKVSCSGSTTASGRTSASRVGHQIARSDDVVDVRLD